MVKVAICGFGVVGSGVYEVLNTNAQAIAKRANDDIEVKYIIDIRDFSGEEFADKVINDYKIAINDPEVSVIAEVIGGTKIAYDITKDALLAGKHVVTSNKELVAMHGAELLAIANEHGVNYMFEASVGGGIPIIRPMVQCLTANEIHEIVGILNGTTNYILTRMINAGLSFEDALQEAKEKGYAEQNPSADVDGHDACRKICILASLAYGKHVYPDKVVTEGISKITLSDVELASKLGYVIKLLGRAILNEDGTIYAYVAPHLIKKGHQLSGVEDVFNAIMLDGNAIGDVMFYGRGAGKLPTASAVVADIIDCAKHAVSRRYLDWQDDINIVKPIDTLKTRYFVRLECAVSANIGEIFGNVTLVNADGMCGFITAEMTESQINDKIKVAQQNGEILSVIKVL